MNLPLEARLSLGGRAGIRGVQVREGVLQAATPGIARVQRQQKAVSKAARFSSHFTQMYVQILL